MNYVDANLRVGSFNILDPSYAKANKIKEGIDNKGISNWEMRKNRVVKLIKDSKLDIVCLQKISTEVFEDLKASLEAEGYLIKGYLIGGYSWASKPGNFSIIYKADRLQMLGGSMIDSEGSIIDLEDKITKKVIRIGCTNLGQKFVKNMAIPPSHSKDIDLRIIAGSCYLDEINYVKAKFFIENNHFSQLIADQYQPDFDLNKEMWDPLKGMNFNPSFHNFYTENQKKNDEIVLSEKRKSDWIFALPKIPGSVKIETDVDLFKKQYHCDNTSAASDHFLIASNISFTDVISAAPKKQVETIQAIQACTEGVKKGKKEVNAKEQKHPSSLSAIISRISRFFGNFMRKIAGWFHLQKKK